MARLVLVLLAALTAGVGIVLGPPTAPWLYGAAGVLVVIALGLWVRQRVGQRRRKERQSARAAEAPDREKELRALGISDVRPRREQREGEPGDDAEAPAVTDDTASSEAAMDEAASDAAEEPAAPASAEEPPAASGEEDSEAEITDTDYAPEEDRTPEPPAAETPEAGEEEAGPTAPTAAPASPLDETLAALVRSVRLASGARAVCLLEQEDWALDYRVEACDTGEADLPLHAPGTVFSTEKALLSAHATRQTVTCRPVVGGETPEGDALPLSALGYYRQPPADAPPEAVALVPISLPDASTNRFLLLDGAQAALDSVDALLKRFASLFAEVIGRAERTSVSRASSSSVSSNGDAAARPESPATSPGDYDGANGEASDPRPRTEIVEEEMRRASDEERPLALALVYLNRAETVAAQGEDEVDAAERALRARLRRAVPEGDGDGTKTGRVERFGELTYGVFLPHESAAAERWAVAVQDDLADARDPLEGGVSIGLALMRGPDQDPQHLRDNATDALREAYTSGTCTILE